MDKKRELLYAFRILSLAGALVLHGTLFFKNIVVGAPLRINLPLGIIYLILLIFATFLFGGNENYFILMSIYCGFAFASYVTVVCIYVGTISNLMSFVYLFLVRPFTFVFQLLTLLENSWNCQFMGVAFFVLLYLMLFGSSRLGKSIFERWQRM